MLQRAKRRARSAEAGRAKAAPVKPPWWRRPSRSRRRPPRVAARAVAPAAKARQARASNASPRSIKECPAGPMSAPGIRVSCGLTHRISGCGIDFVPRPSRPSRSVVRVSRRRALRPRGRHARPAHRPAAQVEGPALRAGSRRRLAWRSASPSATGWPAARHVPRGVAVVFCANHQSNVDPPVLYRCVCTRACTSCSRPELRQLPILGLVDGKTGGFVPVDRGEPRRRPRASSIAGAPPRCSDGNSFLIFPGHPQPAPDQLLAVQEGRLHHGHQGAARRSVPVGDHRRPGGDAEGPRRSRAGHSVDADRPADRDRRTARSAGRDAIMAECGRPSKA